MHVRSTRLLFDPHVCRSIHTFVLCCALLVDVWIEQRPSVKMFHVSVLAGTYLWPCLMCDARPKTGSAAVAERQKERWLRQHNSTSFARACVCRHPGLGLVLYVMHVHAHVHSLEEFQSSSFWCLPLARKRISRLPRSNLSSRMF